MTWFPGWRWFVTPSGENMQGFTGTLRWLWDAPLPAHLIGGAIWLAVAFLLGYRGWQLVAFVVVVLAVQQGAKWDSVRGYGWREILWRLVIGVVPLTVALCLT